MTGIDTIKVSVVIPFYKSKDWLTEALTSVLAQTHTELEIIVVNDGSAMDISELEVLFNSQVNFIHVPNGGAAAARNIGIANSSGTYVAFLDEDDLWLKSKIEAQLHFMEKNNFVWSHTDYYRFKEGTPNEEYVSAALSGHIFPKCLVWNPIATPCVMVKRDVLLQHNLGFEVGKKVGEDNYLWEKLGEQYELGYLPSALTKVRMHNQNVAFQAHLQLKGRGEAVERVRLKKHSFGNSILYYYFLAVLIYCKYAYLFTASIIKRMHSVPERFELVFKALYGIAYLHFRIIRKLI